jgi:membrane-associated phospholipid phosphatase
MIIYIISLISNISTIDMLVTTFIYQLSDFHNLSKLFSKHIINFNIIIRILLSYFFFQHINYLLFNLFIELFIVNICLKRILNRSRPKDSLFLNNTYEPLSNLRISYNFQDLKQNQSFVSGHVTTMTLTWLFIHNFIGDIYSCFYFILVLLTFLARINSGSHYFSDCVMGFMLCFSFYHDNAPLFIINKL